MKCSLCVGPKPLPQKSRMRPGHQKHPRVFYVGSSITRYYALARRSFAHLARCAVAIFLLTAALIVRFFPDVAPLVVAPSRSLRSSSLRPSSFSLIDAACLSCWGVRSVMFIHITTAPAMVTIKSPLQLISCRQRATSCSLMTPVCRWYMGRDRLSNLRKKEFKSS